MLNGFIFKEFAIQQDRCAMKVGTDGVLLGAWARGGKRILDIGSGTGLITMMRLMPMPWGSRVRMQGGRPLPTGCASTMHPCRHGSLKHLLMRW